MNDAALEGERPVIDLSSILATPAMPAENRLEMPTQSLARFDRRGRRRWSNPIHRSTPWLARIVVFGVALLLLAYGTEEMYRVVNIGVVTLLEWILVALFVANFSWIALAFSSSIVGFVWLLFYAPKPLPMPTTLVGKTAVVMPIYNEAPSRIFGALQAMCEEVAATGLGAHFDYFFLSDTTDPDVWVAEERALVALRDRLRNKATVYYRHRPKNINRKAGNIADFVTRWGGAYPSMVVLDADSLMTAHSIVNLAAAMEADPDAGIIQTLPLIINRNTLFARLQQFAARIHGPVIAAGLAVWMGRDGNYWGHNAIIRTQAFADHCGLPHLRGKPPLGGHILSHDFVEAALIRRAGWAVTMLPVLGGSFEESPPSLIDLAARDRRWCQGNLQHARVLGARGFHMASRQHFITGIMGYVASPLWMAQLLVGIVLVLQATYIRPEYFTQDFSLFPAWPRFDAQRALDLFGVTMAVLLAPKLFGLLIALFQPATRKGSGGAIGLILSTIVEIIMSSLAGAHHDGDPIGVGHADPARPRYRLEPAAARRWLDPPGRHRPATSLAHRARLRQPRGGAPHLTFVGGLDVADDCRADPGHPVFLGQRAALDRVVPEAPRPVANARGNDAAADRRAGQYLGPRTGPGRV